MLLGLLSGLICAGVMIAWNLDVNATTETRASAIILFIGDGMGAEQVSAARWLSVGRDANLVMDTLPVHGWSQTASADSDVTDSAAGATALATGVKTSNYRVGQAPDGRPLTTILERARERGMAVGLVTTSAMVDATPAAFVAHVSDRDRMTEIARQMIAAQVDVLLGGGENDFLPMGARGCYPQTGKRTDGRDLVAEGIATGYTYVCDATAFSMIVPSSTHRLLGLFGDDSGVEPLHSPSLVEMTRKAIDILSQNPNGFFLMVEEGRIDEGGHENDTLSVISATLSLDEAVAEARRYAWIASDTLIIVTADHETGGFYLTPDEPPIKHTRLSTTEGTPFYAIWTSDHHTATGVPIMAQGPWSRLLANAHENTTIHHVMNAAIQGSLDTPARVRLTVASVSWEWVLVAPLLVFMFGFWGALSARSGRSRPISKLSSPEGLKMVLGHKSS